MSSSKKVIIVTGASRGIGLAVARLLVAPNQSCCVVAVARSREPLEQFAKDAGDDKVAILPGDFGDLSLGGQAVNLALSKWGRLDGIVINHGMLEPVERVADASITEWKQAFDVNVFSTISIIKAAIPELRKSRGRVILTSSGAAVKATSTWGCYGASKAVLNHLALTLAAEETDLTTVAIRPGVVDTQMQSTLASTHFEKMEQKDADRFRQLKAEGKMLRPEQPGHVIARLVLDAPKELDGKFLNWNDDTLAKFRDL